MVDSLPVRLAIETNKRCIVSKFNTEAQFMICSAQVKSLSLTLFKLENHFLYVLAVVVNFDSSNTITGTKRPLI